MTKLLAGVRLDYGRYDECMAELRRVGVSFDASGIKRAKARIASIYPDLEGYLFMAALRLALLEWRTPTERKKQQAYEIEVVTEKRAKAAQARADRAEIKDLNRKYAEKHGIEIERVASHRLERILREVAEAVEKAQQYEKIEDLLDSWMVGETPLGDCTKDQLLSAAIEWETVGTSVIKRADIYRKIAEKMSGEETVRSASRLFHVLQILKEGIEPLANKEAA